MMDCSGDFNQLLREYIALGRHVGEAQQRCSAMVTDLNGQVTALQAQAMRLRAALVVQTTAQQIQSDLPPQFSLDVITPPTFGTQFISANAVDLDGLDASLAAADLVVCQTGCLSHGAYWRVQDHCKRTGKSCMLVEQPETLRIVRIHQLADGP